MALYNPLNKVSQPVFIVGCGRSGTTLLFTLLSQHPKLVPTQGYPDGEHHEGWIKHGRCVMAGIGNVHHEKYGSGINGQQYCLHMSAEHASAEIVRAMHSYYERDVLGLSIGKRVLNKQPHLSNKLRYVLEIFPDAKIIHIVRDCKPMVASWMTLMNDHPSLNIYWPKDERYPCFWLFPKPKDQSALNLLENHAQFYPGGGAGLFVDYRVKVNEGIVEQMNGRAAQLTTIRYEDLVTDPQQVCREMTDRAQLSQFEFQVDHIVSNTHTKHSHLVGQQLDELRNL